MPHFFFPPLLVLMLTTAEDALRAERRKLPSGTESRDTDAASNKVMDSPTLSVWWVIWGRPSIHSGLSVKITKYTASKMVLACANKSQIRFMEIPKMM